MIAITIWQPWAAAIAHYGKLIENRSWATAYRGEIAIHAAVNYGTWRDYEDGLDRVAELTGLDRKTVDKAAQARGAIIAVANLVGICAKALSGPTVCECGKWAASGPYHHRLANVRPLTEPVRATGRQMLWAVPDDVETAVRAQLESGAPR